MVVPSVLSAIISPCLNLHPMFTYERRFDIFNLIETTSLRVGHTRLSESTTSCVPCTMPLFSTSLSSLPQLHYPRVPFGDSVHLINRDFKQLIKLVQGAHFLITRQLPSTAPIYSTSWSLHPVHPTCSSYN